MSISIIIRSGKTSKTSKSPVFYPHFNRTMDKYYGTAREYYGDLKSKGLEPYDPSAEDICKRKQYKPSNDLKEVTKAIGEHTKKGKFKPSERLLNKMESMGVKMKMTREDLKKLPKHYQNGGFQ